MNYFEAGGISNEKIIQYFHDNNEIKFQTYILSTKEENFLINALEICLIEIGKENIFDFIHYSLKELLTNAKRANIKRVIFLEKNLDINDKNDYQNGMVNFRKVLFEKHEYYTSQLFEKDFYIRVIFKIENNEFKIYIINNSVITTEELKIASESINKAKEFNSIEDALSTIDENCEGAGLGLIITILMLKKFGLEKDAVEINIENRETIVVLKLPLSIITLEQKQIINSIIINEINDLPKFPEYIIDIQNKLDNPEVDLNEIIKSISNDPSLVADILKTANSPLFMFPGQVTSITQAVKLIGILELKKIFYSYGTFHIFNKRYDVKKMKPIWEHAQKVAFFALQLTKKHLKKEYIEDAYIAGILHDIGTILLLAIDPKLMNEINQVCQNKNIPVRIIEEITSGFNHTLIGSMIAKKWNFPKNYVNAIHYHNKPDNCDPEFRELVNCIFLANKMTRTDNKQSIFDNMSTSILEMFNIKSFTDYERLIKELDNEFDSLKDKFIF